MKYICLDIGNVLCTVDSVTFVQDLSETFNITFPEASRFLKRFQQIHDLGYTTMEDELKDHFNLKSPVTLAKLVKTWNDSVQPYAPIIEKLNDLRKEHHLKVALLSNIGLEHAAMMEHILKEGDFFHGAIKHFSCFVGARKPSMLFYQSFLLQHPQFEGSLYVDDLQENLDASKQFGFHTFHMSLELPGIDAKVTEIEKLITEQVPLKNSRWH
jgi:FMN phosphatase YigB (HAD superfamily)